MSKVRLTSKSIDRFGRKLLDTTIAESVEIEKIIAEPDLYDKILSGIEAEESKSKVKASAGKWPSGLSWISSDWLKACLLCAFLIIPGVGAIIILKTQDNISNLRVENVFVHDPLQSPDVLVSRPPNGDEESLNAHELLDATKKPVAQSGNQTFVRQSNIHTRILGSSKSGHRPPPLKPPRNIGEEESGEFFPLITGQVPDEMKEKLTIVRVNMPRSELLAYGINASPENWNDYVKTDLLVGVDGVPQAIRLVR